MILNPGSSTNHLASAAVRGYLSWAPAASQCLRPSQALQQQGTGTETETQAGTETGTGSLTGFEFSFLYQEVLSSGRLLGHQYLQHRRRWQTSMSC